MGKFLKTALALVLAGAGMQASADIVIDDFSIHQAEFFAGTGQVGSNSGTNTLTGPALLDPTGLHIIGGYRDLVLRNNNPNSIGQVSAEVRANPTTTLLNPLIGTEDELVFNIGGGAKATAVITWDGDSTTNNFGTGFDKNFIGLSGFQFWVKSDGGIGGAQLVSIQLKDTSNRTATYTFQAFNTNIPGSVDLFIPGDALFGADFVEAAGFDYGHVAGIQTIINLDGTTDSLDFQLRLVTGVVPEPGTLALGGLAFVAMSWIGRRRRENLKAI